MQAKQTQEEQGMWSKFVDTLPEPVQGVLRSSAAGIAWACFGVIGFLLVYGVLQERIMKHPYGETDSDGHGDMFTWSLFLVMCNRLVTCSVALGMLAWTAPKELLPVAPIYSYAAVSISNVVATYCQYEALKYVSFPLQTLGKTAKMIPVMIWGLLIMKKKYGVKDYLVAVGVTVGCSVFVYYGDEFSSKRASAKETSMYGVLLMLGYLAFDGFTSTFQDKLFKGYSMSTYNQIFYVQGCSAIFSFSSLIAGNQLVPAIAFMSKHPEALGHALALSGAATTANLYISWTIKTFGALIFATIMTTRQFTSILLSCFLFNHPLTWPMQYIGVAITFTALYYKAFAGKSKPKPVSAATEAMKDIEPGPVKA
mmetsp:Transcript_2824/g.10283  ORF Transcript_2824/g.10283 Transcript_2824/m.10283 type:complete len:368 (+) Transcript_2824:79-1182(+)